MNTIFQLQLGRQRVIPEPGRESGMVLCPVKMAHIAVMKCAQFQEGGCRCSSRASTERIRAVQEEIKSEEDH